MEILKAQFELTPEDLIPVIEKVLKRDPMHVLCVGAELFLEIPPITSQRDYPLSNGMVASGDIQEKQSRPEYSRIMFFNREIGSIHITQTSSYPSKSMIVILGCVTPEKDKRPEALDSDTQAAGVLQRLAAGITQTLPSSNFRNDGNPTFTHKRSDPRSPGGHPKIDGLDEAFEFKRAGHAKSEAFIIGEIIFRWKVDTLICTRNFVMAWIIERENPKSKN